MTATAPPRLPRPKAPADPEALEALIEEARRRARRRRQAYGASALVAAAVGVGAFFGFWNSGGGARSSQVEPLPRIAPVGDSPARNGALTIMDSEEGASEDWYGLSNIGSDGRLHPLIRCPYRWCGGVASLDWSADGKWLAF